MNIKKPAYKTSRFWLGMAANVIILVGMYFVISVQYFPATGAIASLFVTAAALVSGLWAGLIAAVFFAIFAASIITDDPARLAVVVTGSFITAAIVGYYHDWKAENKHKVDFVDNLNGNYARLKRAVALIDSLNDPKLADVRSELADLALLTKGWTALARARGFVEDAEDE